jgi:hypothetical protein
MKNKANRSSSPIFYANNFNRINNNKICRTLKIDKILVIQIIGKYMKIIKKKYKKNENDFFSYF